VGWKFVGLDVTVEFRIVRGHGDNFVVAGAGIDHGHQPDRASFDERERLHRLLAQDKHIERIVVLGVRLGNEAIVCR